MKTPLALAALLVACAALPAYAEPDGQREAMRERWQKMTPEQKASARERMKSRWESMSPEEREAAKKRFAERHPGAAARLADRPKPEAPASK